MILDPETWPFVAQPPSALAEAAPTVSLDDPTITVERAVIEDVDTPKLPTRAEVLKGPLEDQIEIPSLQGDGTEEVFQVRRTQGGIYVLGAAGDPWKLTRGVKFVFDGLQLQDGGQIEMNLLDETGRTNYVTGVDVDKAPPAAQALDSALSRAGITNFSIGVDTEGMLFSHGIPEALSYRSGEADQGVVEQAAAAQKVQSTNYRKEDETTTIGDAPKQEPEWPADDQDAPPLDEASRPEAAARAANELVPVSHYSSVARLGGLAGRESGVEVIQPEVETADDEASAEDDTPEASPAVAAEVTESSAGISEAEPERGEETDPRSDSVPGKSMRERLGDSAEETTEADIEEPDAPSSKILDFITELNDGASSRSTVPDQMIVTAEIAHVQIRRMGELAGTVPLDDKLTSLFERASATALALNGFDIGLARQYSEVVNPEFRRSTSLQYQNTLRDYVQALRHLEEALKAQPSVKEETTDDDLDEEKRAAKEVSRIIDSL